ncbi:unnamed protein product, partial [Choristocarpus tenellus]
QSVIYRKYRDGELPDIQIKLGDILRPLQHLAMLDGQVAREVFVRLFQAIYAGLGDEGKDAFSQDQVDSPGWRKNTGSLLSAGCEGGKASKKKVAQLLQRMLRAARNDTCQGELCWLVQGGNMKMKESKCGSPDEHQATSVTLSCTKPALPHSLAFFPQVRLDYCSHCAVPSRLTDDVVACLHAACRATALQAPTVTSPDDDDSAITTGVASGKRKGRGKASISQPKRSRSQKRYEDSDHPVAVERLVQGLGEAQNPEVQIEDRDIVGPSGAVSLPPSLVADTAISSLNLHSGIVLLEEALIRGKTGKCSLLPLEVVGHIPNRKQAGKIRGMGSGSAVGVGLESFSEANQDHWLQLSRLYAALGERDVLVGLSARASRLERTRSALEEELAGDFSAALAIYSDLARKHDTRFEPDSENIVDMTDGDNGEGEASAAELTTWDLHQLECMRQLGKWKDLKESVLILASESFDEDESETSNAIIGNDAKDMLWSNPLQRDQILPYYVWSMVHDEERDLGELKAFLEAATSSDAPPIRLDPSDPTGGSMTRLRWLEQNLPGELARAWLIKGDLGRAHQCVSLCYDRFLERWSGLHPCADAARREQLRGLQLVVEVEDYLSFHDTWGGYPCQERNIDKETGRNSLSSKSIATADPHRHVQGLLRRWSGQLPSRQLDPVASWNAIITHRKDCLQDIHMFVLERASKAESSRCKVDMLWHRGNLALAAAGASIAQGVHQVAERMIISYTDIKKHIRQLSTLESRSDWGGISGGGMYEGKGSDDWDLDLTMSTVDYNRAVLERLKLKKIRSDHDVSTLRGKKISNTLRVLRGCLAREEENSAEVEGGFKKISGNSMRNWSDGSTTVVWDDKNAEAKYTRMRLLTLQGEWLEAEGSHRRELGEGGEGWGGGSLSLREALLSHEKAAWIGQELISSTVGMRGGPSMSKVVLDAAGEAMLRLAKVFLSDRKNGAYQRTVSGADTRENLAALSVQHYMHALAAGSSGARDRFPRVLFLIGEFPQAREVFVEGSHVVPEWAFLRWAPQMLALLGRPEGHAIFQVLEKVAKAYPRALFYPLLITNFSKGKTHTSNLQSGPQRRDTEETAARLAQLVADPSAEAFVEALRGLHHPELRFLDGMKRVRTLLGTKNLNRAKSAYLEVREDCL